MVESADETTTPVPPRPPRGLLAAGRRLWRQVTGTYELRADELTILERACRTVDDLTDLDNAMSRAASLTVEGSMGQMVAHPLLAERRHHAVLLSRLLRQLGLPDDDGERTQEGDRLAREWHARRAARERWSR